MMVLKPDFTWIQAGDVRVGDLIMGRTLPAAGKHGVLVPTVVTAVSRRDSALIRVDGDLICSADKKVWSTGKDSVHRSGWRLAASCEGVNVTYLAPPPKRDQAMYEHGYLAGMADGDGCFWTLRTDGKRPYRRFRLAVNDHALLGRTRDYAARAGYVLRPGTHGSTGFSGGYRTMDCLWLTNDAQALAFEAWLTETPDDESWAWGYLAGITDAEGSVSAPAGTGGQIRIAQSPGANPATYERIASTAARLGFSYAREAHGIRLLSRGGEMWRFMIGATPAKPSLLRSVIGRAPNNGRTVQRIEDAGYGEVVSLTTDVGSYIAEGYVVHNCDAAYTWDASRYDLRREIRETPVAEILAQVASYGTGLTVITGGEPLLHQRRPGWRALLALPGDIEVETNGTQLPDALTLAAVARFNVSPKLAHAGDPIGQRVNPGVLGALAAGGKSIFKFVVREPDDLAEVAEIVAAGRIAAPLVWVMPEGTTADVLLSRTRALADPVLAAGWNYTNRLHILCWGDERGR